MHRHKRLLRFRVTAWIRDDVGYKCVLQVGLVNLCHYVHIVKVLIITYYTTVLSSVTLESLSDDVMRCLCAKYPEIPRVLSLRAFRLLK